MGLFQKLKEKFNKKHSETENVSPVSNEKETQKVIEKNIDTYEKGMEKTSKAFAGKLKELSKKYKKVNAEYFDQLEEILIEADVGVELTLNTIQQLISLAKEKKIDDANKLNEELIDLLFAKYMKNDEKLKTDLVFEDNKTTICLVTGVNGVGKTTSIAKLAYRYKNLGKKVLLVAADTFRAGAKEQLQKWADKIGVEIVTGRENQDPASVVFDGLNIGKKINANLIIVDTAGRLQNKTNLMNELNKIYKVINKEAANSIIESLLIIDATTGQNGVKQARSFYETSNLTGIIITKMDGTSKGGIILPIRDELNIPVRFIGLGEKMEDLQGFDLEKYLYCLCVGNENGNEE